MLLTRTSTGLAKDGAAQSRLTRSVSGMLGNTIDRRTFLRRSGIALGAGAVASQLPFYIMGKADAAQEAARRQAGSQAHGLHALLGRMRDRRRGPERCMDPAGAGVRLADQSRRALRQRRVDPRARYDARFPPPEIPDEARRRQMETDFAGTRRSRKSATSCSPSGRRAGPTQRSGSAPRSTTTSRRICCASSCRSSAPTTWTTRRASATRPRSRAWRIPGATVR